MVKANAVLQLSKQKSCHEIYLGAYSSQYPSILILYSNLKIRLKLDHPSLACLSRGKHCFCILRMFCLFTPIFCVLKLYVKCI